MFCTIRLNDETYQKIAERAPIAPNSEIARIVELFIDQPTDRRSVVLEDKVREEIEKLYGRAIEDQQHFLTWLKNMSAAKIADVDIPLTSEQNRRLAAEAAFKNKDPRKHKVVRIQEVLRHGFGF